MNEASREARINQAFVRVADTLMNSYDMIDLLATLIDECVDLLEIESGGLLIADETGELQLIASSSEDAEFVEVMQLAAGEGPCMDCYRTGRAVSVGSIAQSTLWPAFREDALQRGFRAVHAVPLRVRGEAIGTLNLLGASEGEFSERDSALAQALADVSVIGILQERSLRDARAIASQLQLALDTRILVEQAKGVLAQVQSIGMDEAFRALRAFARHQALTLREVAHGVVDRSIDAASVVVRR